jgi:Flp pilus assembly protein TadG
MAVILTSLMGLAGAGVDYGLIVIETSRLQNAVDAASLAGARALVTSTGATQSARDADGEAAAVTFLGLHGYVTGTNGATFTYVKSSSDTAANASHDTMQVTGSIVKPTSFWKVIGINSTTLNRTATAVASGGMVDVMLSLDLTGSMDVNGTDMPNLQAAVVAFVNQMQLSTTDPRGSQVGIARWAGTICSWTRGNPVANTRTPTPASAPDGDNRIDWNKNEYTLPCFPDASVLSYLGQDKNVITKIANATPSTPVACPTKPAAPTTPSPYSPASMTDYACPLDSYPLLYTGLNVIGTPVVPAGVDNHTWSGVTGTNLANSIKIVNGNTTGCYAWGTSTAACPTNGRNDAATTGLARKVLVIITDGFSQLPFDTVAAYPTYTGTATPGTYTAPESWNVEAIDLANRLKKGPDNNASTTDDNVEIYVIGFFPTPYDGTDSGVLNWKRSRAASTGSVAAGNHPCPNATLPASSARTFSYNDANSIDPGVDEILNNISSSKAGSCDHYYPIAKSEGSSLPQLFRVVAGSIARGRLQ